MFELKNVTKTFFAGTANEKKALRGVSFTLEDGDFCTVIGSNGAGKSTTLNAIAGAFPIDSGSILIDGVDVSRMPEYKRAAFIGRVFQDPMRGTAAGMMISENLAIADRRGRSQTLRWSDRADRTAYFTELVKMLGLGLENRMTAHVGLLSGGQRQALTLLMATMVPPQLLLLDEHTAALDPATAEKVLDLTRRVVAESHITCLMVTHNMHQALELGNRTLMMADGHIVLDVAGSERAGMGVDDLIARFKAGAGHELDNDRILLSE